jgi:hypothetical protein
MSRFRNGLKKYQVVFGGAPGIRQKRQPIPHAQKK